MDDIERMVRDALTSEDEIAHGEAVKENASRIYIGLGVCAYCDQPWPCRTQRGIDRLLARMSRDAADRMGRAIGAG